MDRLIGFFILKLRADSLNCYTLFENSFLVNFTPITFFSTSLLRELTLYLYGLSLSLSSKVFGSIAYVERVNFGGVFFFLRSLNI